MEEKKIQIMDLLSYAIGIPEMKYFNLDSDELLDEKIEVLTQIKEGKTIAEIPNFYKVLEDLPEDERRQAEEQERLQAQAKRDLDLTIKGLKLDVVDAVQEMGLDAGFRNLIAVEDLATIADEDERKTKLTERVKGMKKLFDAEVAKEVAKAKAEFLKGSTPATGSTSKKDETKYDAYKKAGNVKGMISEKLSAHRNREDEE